jgi:hypothetical protein
MLILILLIIWGFDARQIKSHNQCSLVSKEIPLEKFYPLDTIDAVLTNDAKYLFQVKKSGDISVWDLDNYKLHKNYYRNESIGETYQRLTVWDNYVVADSVWGSNYDTIMTIIDLRTFDTVKLNAQTIMKDFNWRYSCHTISKDKIIYVSSVNYSDKSSTIFLYDLTEKKEKYLFTSKFSIQGILLHDNSLILKESSKGTIIFYSIDGRVTNMLNQSDDMSDVWWSPVKNLQLTSDSRYLITHSTNIFQIQIWDLYHNKLVYMNSWFGWGRKCDIITTLNNTVIYSDLDSKTYIWDSTNITAIKHGAYSYAYYNDKLLLGYDSLVIYDYHNKQVTCKSNTTQYITQIVPIDDKTFITLSDKPLIWFYL